MPSTQVATTLTAAGTASFGYCFPAALKLLPPACIYQGSFSFAVGNSTFLHDIVALSAVKEVLCDQSRAPG